MGAGTFLYLLWSNLSGNHLDPEGRNRVHTRGLLQHSWVIPSAGQGQIYNGLAYK